MIWQKEFSFGEAVNATGATASAIKGWLHKGVIIGADQITGGRVEGKRRGYKLHTLLEIATAKAVLDQGSSDLSSAFSAAHQFAHSTGTDDRKPGTPFPSGFTYLAVSGERSKVFNYVPGSDFMADLRIALNRPEGMILLDMNAVFDRVTSRLGIHPQAAIDAMYEGEIK